MAAGHEAAGHHHLHQEAERGILVGGCSAHFLLLIQFRNRPVDWTAVVFPWVFPPHLNLSGNPSQTCPEAWF